MSDLNVPSVFYWYRVIQRDCHKWKCYQITLNWVFIDFWGIFRFHILGGLLFKATLDPNRHYWLLWPIFWCPIVFEAILLIFSKNTNLAVLPYFFMGPLMLVNLSWFLCDPNDSAKFRSSRRELWGTFPSVVPISKKPQIQPCRQKTAHWAAEWALSREGEALKFYQDMGVNCDMFPQNWVCLDPKNGDIVGVAWQNNWFQGLKKIM